MLFFSYGIIARYMIFKLLKTEGPISDAPFNPRCHCPASRTTLVATRFWVVMICPIIKCLTVLEFSFILFDLCLFITIFNFILNYVPIVTFWILTYHKIWILLIIFLYGTIELFILWHVWRYSGVLWVNSCPPLSRPTRQSCMSGHCYTIGCVIKSTHGAYVVVVQLLTLLKLHFIMEWLL